VRAFFQYIKEKSQGAADRNCAVKLIMCAINCVLCLLAKFLDFICDQAYIVTAMQGENLCSSFREAWRLISKDIKLTMTVQYMANLVLGFGKWCIVCTSTLLMFAILEAEQGSTLSLALGSVKTNIDSISNPMLPILGCMLFSYYVAATFMDVYYMSIEVLMLSFTKDIELNGPGSKHFDQATGGRYAMSENLRSFMNTDAKAFAFRGLNYKKGKGDTYTVRDKDYEKRVI
jgi:hypothetical protein